MTTATTINVGKRLLELEEQAARATRVCAALGWTEAVLDKLTSGADFPRPATRQGGAGQMSSQQVQVRKKPQPWPEQIRVSGECWLWSGGVHKGYGRYAGEQAHRAVYRDLVGPIPLGLELDHTCKTPLCVNPAHLEPVTRAENQRRRAAAQTHCRNGHEFTLKNTYIHTTPRGLKVRHCRACNRAASQRQALKKRGVR